MKAFDLQVTGSLVVTGSIKTTDGTFILSGSDSNASSSFSSRITTNESNMTLATASIAALTASVAEMKEFTKASTISGSFTSVSSSIATRFDSRETDMTLATASIAAITASVSTLKSNVGQELNTDSNVTFGVITSGDINSSGTITATEIHTTFVSSSIAIASGSNIFGDDTADSHQFTGSLLVSGSAVVSGSATISGLTTFNDIVTANSRINTQEIRGSSVAIKDANADLMAWFQDGSSRLYSNGYNLRLESNNELNLYNANTAATVHINYHGAGSRVDIANTELDVIKGTGSTFAGNVGIGGSPDTLLNLKDTGGIEVRLEADSNNSGQEDCFIRFYTDGKTQEGIAGMDNNNSSTLFTTNTENAMVFGTVSNLPVVFATNNTEKMQIAADGKVGIGTSSPAADLHVSGSSGKILMSDHGQVTLEMQTNDTAAIFQRDLGSTATSGISSAIFMQGKDTANELMFHVNYGGGSGGNNYNRRLRLTQTSASFENCNVGIGTTNPLEKLHVEDGDILVSSARGVRANGGQEMIRFDSSDGVKINSGNAERLRVKTSGQIETTYNDSSYNLYINGLASSATKGILMSVGPSSGTVDQMLFRDGANDNCGTITSNAGANTTAFGTSSDYRLKENQIIIPNALERLNKIKPYRFNFISAPDQTMDGFFAHELAEYIPEAVVGEKDAMEDGEIKPQNIDYGKITPLLVKALQEADDKIEALTARIEALES